MAVRRDDAPCFVFGEVPGSITGSRVLVNFFGGKRKNMTLGFPAELSKVELSDGFRVHYAAPMKRIPPRYVESGPVMQNVMTGEAIDVTKFPAPQWHRKDGGPTELQNLCRLCRRHHIQKTVFDYQISGKPGAWIWETPWDQHDARPPPDDPGLLYDRGEVSVHGGDPDGGLADWRGAHELDPEDFGPVYASAFLLE